MSQEVKLALSESQSSYLRKSGLLQEYEFAYTAGDLVVAENATTGEKRVLGKTEIVLTESNNKRVLKG